MTNVKRPGLQPAGGALWQPGRTAHREQRQPLLMAEPKKQIPLRLNAELYEALAAWAEDDFRSVNGQIEYLLTECVRQRKKNGRYVSDQIDLPPELDIE